MIDSPAVHLITHFSPLPDPRLDRRKAHLLIEILVIAVCATICGADSWVAIAEFGRAKQDWLKTFLARPNGIPSHDTFRRVFLLLSPAHFQECFIQWVQAVIEVFHGQVVAVDGKTARRSCDPASGKGPLHMVHAWATQNRVVVGQYPTEEGSNEITAIPELRRALAVKGCIVRVDAIGCQKEIAAQIIDQEADYVLAIKANQPTVWAYAQQQFATVKERSSRDGTIDYWETRAEEHGRVEIRRCWTTDQLADLPGREQWKGVRSLGLVEAQRQGGQQVSIQRRYYLSSRGSDAFQMGEAVRAHWGIENSLHWVLDVAFHEDDCRLRTGYGAENMAVLRHLAVSLLQQEKSAKVGIPTKRLKAGWDTHYLAKVLAAGHF